MRIILVAGRGARFKGDALRQRVYRLKQRKIDMRLRICFNGLHSKCCIEALSDMVKTVEDHEAIKTSLNGP